jgi:hypothetical protein
MRQRSFPAAFKRCGFFAAPGATLKANRKTLPHKLRAQRLAWLQRESSPAALAELQAPAFGSWLGLSI